MARMLEALKRAAEPRHESVEHAELHEDAVVADQIVEAAAPVIADVEMPYIEVGGPRQQQAIPAATTAPPPAHRAATLKLPVPAGVTLAMPARQASKPRVAAELIAFHQPEHSVSQEYAELFAQVVAEPEEGTQVLVFSSLAAGAGTTTSLLNLAIAGCGVHHRQVVVVDANFARPAVASRLGLGRCKGLGDVLRGTMALEQALQSTGIANLQILPAGETDLVLDHVDALRWILGWLRDRFDAVLVDGPPWGENSEDWYRTLARASDAFYLVVDAGESVQPRVRAMMRDLGKLGGHLGGLIVTR